MIHKESLSICNMIFIPEECTKYFFFMLLDAGTNGKDNKSCGIFKGDL